MSAARAHPGAPGRVPARCGPARTPRTAVSPSAPRSSRAANVHGREHRERLVPALGVRRAQRGGGRRVPGERVDAVAVVAGRRPTPPCGGCRQVLCEFGPEMLVVSSAGGATGGWTLRRSSPTHSVPRTSASSPADRVTGELPQRVRRGGRAAERGKSTLVNALVGREGRERLDKPQTTRRDVRAVLTAEEPQIVFTDTPGFHKPRTLLGRV